MIPKEHIGFQFGFFSIFDEDYVISGAPVELATLDR